MGKRRLERDTGFTQEERIANAIQREQVVKTQAAKILVKKALAVAEEASKISEEKTET